MLRGAELAAQLLERRRVLVVAVDIAQQRDELLERRPIDTAAVLLEAVVRPLTQLLETAATWRLR